MNNLFSNFNRYVEKYIRLILLEISTCSETNSGEFHSVETYTLIYGYAG